MQQLMFEGFGIPEWQKCFKTCKHFRDVKNDTFPGTNIERCRYHSTVYGTSGDQFILESTDHVVRMYCKLYEEKAMEGDEY